MPVKVSRSSLSVFYSHPGSGDSSRNRPREARTGNASGVESLVVLELLDMILAGRTGDKGIDVRMFIVQE